jgi:hypothetical protein
MRAKLKHDFDNGSLYTEQEWLFFADADYEFADDGEVLLNGWQCGALIEEL